MMRVAMNLPPYCLLTLVGVMFMGSPILARSLCATEPTYTSLAPDRAHWQRIKVHSPWQSAPTLLRIRAPKSDKPLPVIYVLPVEAEEDKQWGDPLQAVDVCDPTLLQRAIFVAPTFAQLPWYADHPSDPGVQQEKHFLKAVMPYITGHFSTKDQPLLLGFSKSGWGAWSVLLRYPDRFARAVAWDAPLMTMDLKRYGMRPIFGSLENLRSYQITELIKRRAQNEISLGMKRLALFGNSNFLAEHEAAHALLTDLALPHAFALGPKRKHHWQTGWLESAVCFLLDGSPKRPKRQQGPLKDPR